MTIIGIAYIDNNLVNYFLKLEKYETENYLQNIRRRLQ